MDGWKLITIGVLGTDELKSVVERVSMPPTDKTPFKCQLTSYVYGNRRRSTSDGDG